MLTFFALNFLILSYGAMQELWYGNWWQGELWMNLQLQLHITILCRDDKSILAVEKLCLFSILRPLTQFTIKKHATVVSPSSRNTLPEEEALRGGFSGVLEVAGTLLPCSPRMLPAWKNWWWVVASETDDSNDSGELPSMRVVVGMLSWLPVFLWMEGLRHFLGVKFSPPDLQNVTLIPSQVLSKLSVRFHYKYNLLWGGT